MVSLILSFVILIGGYFIYSRFISRAFSPDSRRTPAITINDGVDCVPMPKRKLVLVQLLNIAGTGPIFGPIMGAVFGPVVFLWIIIGTLLGGAVHDFMIGMISMRHNGSSIAELSGIYGGKILKWFMRIFSVVLLILCDTVFLLTPATLLASLTPAALNEWFWIIVILAYYVLATLLPIDKIIGKLYPIFGILLFVMAFSVLIAVFAQGKAINIPEFWNGMGQDNPNGLPTWPFMFVTVACGAISGFHATQSPMVSKCVRNEKQGRQIFYGAMVGEAVIALIWAAVGVAFYGSTQLLQEALSRLGGAGPVVHEICNGLLGNFGGILAIIGVVVCPITSGDTAFRGARLIIAETFHLDQRKIANRLIITIPLFGVAVALCFLNFDVLWRYFAAANQTLAMIALWIASIYLLKKNKFKQTDLLTAVPAAFMVAVSITYIIVAKECFNAPTYIGYPIGASVAVASFIAYVIYRTIYYHKHKDYHPFMQTYISKRNKIQSILNNNLKEEIKKKHLYLADRTDVWRYSASYLTDYEKSFYRQNAHAIDYLKREKEELIAKYNKGTNAIKRFNARYKIFKTNREINRIEKKNHFYPEVFFDISKYIFCYALKHGVVYGLNKRDNDFVIVFPCSFQGIPFDGFRSIPLKLKFLLSFNSALLDRFEQYEEEIKIRQEDTLQNRYYIYLFMNSNKKNGDRLLLPLLSLSKRDNLPIYLDVLNNKNKRLFANNGFKIALEEKINYYDDTHTVLLHN